MSLPRFLLPLLLLALPLRAQTSWQQHFLHTLPLLGRGDWIVIADPAYPLQTPLGIDTVATGLSQPDLLTVVLDTLASDRHVRPIFFTASELPFVSERDANGIGSYRAQLATLLRTGTVTSLPQQQIETMVDDAARTCHVLVLKSVTLLPYTAVFIKLDSAYWSPDAEKRLRAAMQPK